MNLNLQFLLMFLKSAAVHVSRGVCCIVVDSEGAWGFPGIFLHRDTDRRTCRGMAVVQLFAKTGC